MPDPNQAALDFLLTRRSRPQKTLGLPVPDRASLMPILTAAARSPDHGILEPWRFIVIEQAAMARLAGLVTARGPALGKSDEDVAKARLPFETGSLAVAVIEVQKPSPKVPAVEQTYSAGAVCLSLLNAALASGWGANWITGWPSHDPVWRAEALGLSDNERVAGIVHIGTETAAPPERARPDVNALVTWMAT